MAFDVAKEKVMKKTSVENYNLRTIKYMDEGYWYKPTDSYVWNYVSESVDESRINLD